MNSKHKLSDLTTGHRPGTDGGAMIGPEVRVIGVSRRIWIILGVMALLVVGLALAYFRAQGALDTTSETLKTAIESAKMAEIALKHETEAKEQAIADREQLVKELSAQGDRLAEFSRGEEQAKTKANQASTGVE